MKKWWILLGLLPVTLHGATYEVGPGRAYTAISDVAWESLNAGDTVLIHHRPLPYQEKWVICRQGTASQPITVRGVPDQDGNLPVISGSNATTRLALNYWNESRGIIKIGGASIPPDTMPAHIVIENLDIQSGRPGYSFTDDAGNGDAYVNNAAAIYIEKGSNLVIRNCRLSDCGNGLFSGHQSSDLLVEYCRIFDNGIEGRFYEHNNYTESDNITFQYNYFGGLRPGCDGNNLKDRSKGCTIRYNWIEDGNRQLDLVDSDYAEFYNDPAYRSTYVYGNVLVESDGEGNSQMIHYGGDSGSLNRYRKGTLHLYNNTIISTRSGNTTLVRLSSNDESMDCRNNIIYTTADGSRLGIVDSAGAAWLRDNWIKSGWGVSHGNSTAAVFDVVNNTTGADPGMINIAAQDFRLSATSSCVNSAGMLSTSVPPEHVITQEYVEHQGRQVRVGDGQLDRGAFEAILDSDSDAIPDWWEYTHFGGTTNAAADDDQDGDNRLNGEEFISDTVPTNNLSYFAVDTVMGNDADNTISFMSSASRIYQLEAASMGGHAWHAASAPVPGTGGQLTLIHQTNDASQLYRVMVTIP